MEPKKAPPKKPAARKVSPRKGRPRRTTFLALGATINRRSLLAAAAAEDEDDDPWGEGARSCGEEARWRAGPAPCRARGERARAAARGAKAATNKAAPPAPPADDGWGDDARATTCPRSRALKFAKEPVGKRSPKTALCPYRRACSPRTRRPRRAEGQDRGADQGRRLKSPRRS